MTTRTATHIRWMIRKDLSEVLAIERAAEVNYWGEEDFCRMLKGRDTIGLVSEIGEAVAAYSVYGMRKTHLDLVKLCVCRDYLRQGIGSAVIDKLKSKLHPNRRTHIICIVHERHITEQHFLRSQQFFCERIRRDYYADGDGYEFVYRLPEGGA